MPAAKHKNVTKFVDRQTRDPNIVGSKTTVSIDSLFGENKNALKLNLRWSRDFAILFISWAA
jgi:hypothetical protein